MGNFLVLYGRRMAGTMMLCIVTFFAGWLLYYEWLQYGVASDGGSADWQRGTFEQEVPILDTQCRKVQQGDVVWLKELAVAKEETGEDISENITFQGEDGTVLTGKLDTSKPGEYILNVSVKSEKSGKTRSKKIIVLVDGKVSG